jgi:DMSO/TMAO reductase YedYZ molybdopterin-dependent catalytic subunit
MVSLNSLIAEQWSGLPLADMLEETVVNSVAAWVCFQATDSFPAAVERRRLHRQARWGRRNF